MEKISVALDKKDYEMIRFISHEIKGSAGGFGPYEASFYAAQVEDAARLKDELALKKSIGVFFERLKLLTKKLNEKSNFQSKRNKNG